MEPIKKIALITGGIGGIGTAICERLYKDGCVVIANYRDFTRAIKWREQAKNWRQNHLRLGIDVKIVEGDVSDFRSTSTMIKQIQDEMGVVNILVNNAGITRDAPLYKMKPQQWYEVINTNLHSVYNCTRLVIEGMIAQGWGRIINISSINGQKGQFGQTNYSAAKAGMHGFTMALAAEVAKKGITVNTISPGYIGTSMVMAVREEIRNQIISQIPIGRLGNPEEIARVVSFLVSEESSFITGSNISANGGQFMG
ncbi:MAG: beta-ketoacyl-ACP reductase [Bacteroidetes bacterium RIFCSPLOWO2_02_FULL_36_8]|nr:MAG: beta-ketoacyl-ACP reductase [Bacteroidetes bacterium RIFCSPLOWO2_02_FULL_36_8]OFY69634.1 MAG: beta-ketoacyl-ACP reductase [Bacteroidetes bacterium RIFCSPLOWO2_12_FULL_37_12]